MAERQPERLALSADGTPGPVGRRPRFQCYACPALFYRRDRATKHARSHRQCSTSAAASRNADRRGARQRTVAAEEDHGTAITPTRRWMAKWRLAERKSDHEGRERPVTRSRTKTKTTTPSPTSSCVVVDLGKRASGACAECRVVDAFPERPSCPAAEEDHGTAITPTRRWMAAWLAERKSANEGYLLPPPPPSSCPVVDLGTAVSLNVTEDRGRACDTTTTPTRRRTAERKSANEGRGRPVTRSRTKTETTTPSPTSSCLVVDLGKRASGACAECPAVDAFPERLSCPATEEDHGTAIMPIRRWMAEWRLAEQTSADQGHLLPPPPSSSCPVVDFGTAVSLNVTEDRGRTCDTTTTPTRRCLAVDLGKRASKACAECLAVDAFPERSSCPAVSRNVTKEEHGTAITPTRRWMAAWLAERKSAYEGYLLPPPPSSCPVADLGKRATGAYSECQVVEAFPERPPCPTAEEDHGTAITPTRRWMAAWLAELMSANQGHFLPPPSSSCLVVDLGTVVSLNATEDRVRTCDTTTTPTRRWTAEWKSAYEGRLLPPPPSSSCLVVDFGRRPWRAYGGCLVVESFRGPDHGGRVAGHPVTRTPTSTPVTTTLTTTMTPTTTTTPQCLVIDLGKRPCGVCAAESFRGPSPPHCGVCDACADCYSDADPPAYRCIICPTAKRHVWPRLGRRGSIAVGAA